MHLRFICIEVRKNIRCANVFLQFDQSPSNEVLKILVDEKTLRLCEYSTEICAALEEHFTIEAKTISNLNVKGCNASFRLSINNIMEESASSQTCKIGDCSLQLKENIEATLHCSNCKNIIIATQKFVRIREFPSGSIDMGEFFCHHGPDFGELLVPQCTDLFYGFQFVVLNRALMQSATREKESHLYCRRCLQYLGEELLAGKSYKLWADTLRFKVTDSAELFNLFSSNTSNESSTLELMRKIIRETTDITEVPSLLQQLQFSKVLLQATFPNRQSKYLLLHILEKQLQVLRNTEPFKHISDKSTNIVNNNNVLHVQLQRFQCFKLLYRLIDDESSQIGEADEAQEAREAGDAEKALLDNWQQDISIHTLKISPTLFSTLLQELVDNSKLMRDNFTTDDFQLTYVFY